MRVVILAACLCLAALEASAQVAPTLQLPTFSFATVSTTVMVPDSGATFTQHFCPACGTHIYAQRSARPHIRTLRIGVIDQPHDLAPQAVIWTDEAPAWAVFDPDLERFARQPPPPAPAPQG